MNEDVLVIKNLNVYCPSPGVKRGQVKVLDSIGFVLKENEVLGLVGESGSGKSVLINAIGCNLTPPLWMETETLSIILDSHMEELNGKSEDDLRKIWGKEIAFVPTNARERFNPILTVGRQCSDIISTNLKLSFERAREKVIEMFRMVQMPDPQHNFDNYVHELSGGMAQRVLLSLAFSMSPRLLLADEPSMGLDLTIQRQVLDLMATLIRKAQSSVILATRDLGIVANYCTKVAVLRKGEIIEFAGVREFFKNPRHSYSYSLLEASFASFGGREITAIGKSSKR